jgi:hypothetical protein
MSAEVISMNLQSVKDRYLLYLRVANNGYVVMPTSALPPREQGLRNCALAVKSMNSI